MLKLIQIILRLWQKEVRILSGYSRSHPHFIFQLFIDITFSLTLIFVGIIFASTQNSYSNNHVILTHSGVISMSYGEVINHLEKDNRPAYWLGYMPNYTYAPTSIVLNVIAVTYYEPGSSPKDGLKHLMVETFIDIDSFNQALKSPEKSAIDLSSFIDAKGNMVKYNEEDLDFMIVSFPHSSYVVVITYPKKQTLEKMVSNLELLVSVY